MTALAPALSRFFENTCLAISAPARTPVTLAYSFQLLVTFAARQLQKAPSQLE